MADRRRWTLRARLTATATMLLALGLCAGGLLLVATVHGALIRGLDSGALASAREVGALIDAGQLSTPVPVGGPTKVVQVVDAQGRVRAASAGADHLVPFLSPPQLAQVRAGRRLSIDTATTGPVRVVGLVAGPTSDRQTVIVATGIAEVLGSLRVVRVAVLIGVPVLVVALALVSWLVIGRALRPVEQLRAGAADITGAGTQRRLPVPAGRDEVHRLAVTLNDMLDRLEAARSRQRAFVADAAHELRSPLTSARTQLEVATRRMARGGEPLSTDEIADILVDTDRLSRLIDDLLLLARMDDAASHPARRESVDLTALAREVGAPWPQVRVHGPAVVVSGDREQLRRVLANLTDNAVRHASSAVTIILRRAGDDVCLSIVDDGPGVPEADRERVFERFTRLDSARARQDGGAGLGLAIVRELVKAHGGSVALADGSPGLRVDVRFPVG